MDHLQELLQEYWGYENFRPLQRDIMESVLDGRDTLALLPTGGGKSLCYQVPALAREGICLVVSPLIALMKDQVENLRRRGILSLALYSGLSRRMLIQQLKNAASGTYKVLYVSPERLETALFREYLPALDVSLIAVDEAHCISQWGYDFRPSYLNIASLRAELPGVPVLALTASATAEVERDIADKLQLRQPRFFRQSFERKNLSYSVLPVEVKQPRLVDIIQKVPGTAIVYCRSRRRTVEVAGLLRLHGIRADHYHAGLAEAERSRRQEAWMAGTTRVMVCTNAFGMGIDKPDVRLVVHADLPESLEHYYQEAGRAGRDGAAAYAVLLCSDKDRNELQLLCAERYPNLERIKAVYHALVNFLQLPVHAGLDQSYPFSFEDFTRNFKLDAREALYALKALESDGWLELNEKSYLPSTLTFITSKRGLYDFQASHPEHEPLLTTLLRTYEGIFDVPVFISELQLARMLRLDEAALVAALKRIASFGILSYVPRSDAPQLIFRRSRVTVEDLRFDLKAYEKRKAAFAARVAQILAYTDAASCRARYINQYFGDKSTADCGICDRCRAARRQPLQAGGFEVLHQQIRQVLAKAPLPPAGLLDALPGTGQEQAWEALRYLQSEGIIEMDGQGRLRLKKAAPLSSPGAPQA